MIGREPVDEGGDLFHHGVVDFARHDVAAVTLGKRDDADRQRRPADDVGRRRPAPAVARPALSRTSSDDPPPISNRMTPGRRRIEQFGAAGRRQPRLGRGIDDFQFEAGLLGDAGAEFLAVLGGAASLGGDQPRARHAARAHLVAADQQRLDRARDRRLADAARGGDALAEPDDAGERVDDAKAVGGRTRDQQPAIIGAEIERGIGRAA